MDEVNLRVGLTLLGPASSPWRATSSTRAAFSTPRSPVRPPPIPLGLSEKLRGLGAHSAWRVQLRGHYKVT